MSPAELGWLPVFEGRALIIVPAHGIYPLYVLMVDGSLMVH